MEKKVRSSFRCQTIRVIELLSQYSINGNGLYVDYAFQRRNTAWDNWRKREFICSIFKGGQSAPMVYADINTGKMKESHGSSGYSSYEEASMNGENYVSLDGLQRTTTLVDFVDGKFGITGEFRDYNDNLHTLKNITYGKLPESLKMTFDTAMIAITVHEHYLYDELPPQFRTLNSGDAINRMESRNSYQSPMAIFIRSMGYDEKNPQAPKSLFWERLQGKAKVGRMEDLDALCNLALFSIKDFNGSSDNYGLVNVEPKDENKDKLYEIGDGHSDFGMPSLYNEDEVYKFRLIFELSVEIFNTQSLFSQWHHNGRLPRYMFWAVFFFTRDLIYRNLMVGKSIENISTSCADAIVKCLYTWHVNMKNSAAKDYAEEFDKWLEEKKLIDDAIFRGVMTEEEANRSDEPSSRIHYHEYYKWIKGTGNRSRYVNEIESLTDHIVRNNSKKYIISRKNGIEIKPDILEFSLFDATSAIDGYISSATIDGTPKKLAEVA